MTADQIDARLESARQGDPEAIDWLVSVLYQELRRLARAQLSRRGGRSPTLHTTALVHEAYVKLTKGRRLPARDRSHFLSVAARAMRQVIVEHVRTRHAKKRGGRDKPLPLSEGLVAAENQAEELLDLDRALGRLEEVDGRLVRIVECRFFVGLTEEQTAAALEVSRRTVQRDWMKARAWLRLELERPILSPE